MLYMFIVYVSISDVQKYFKTVDANTSASVTPASSPATAVSPVGGLSELQQQMVQQFSVQSGMNAAWSARYVHNLCHLIDSETLNLVWQCCKVLDCSLHDEEDHYYYYFFYPRYQGSRGI